MSNYDVTTIHHTILLLYYALTTLVLPPSTVLVAQICGDIAGGGSSPFPSTV